MTARRHKQLTLPRVCAWLLAISLGAASAFAQPPVRYRVSFPTPEHRWAQVDAVFAEVGTDALRLRMSRSSPGRYALHEFAKNVYDVEILDGAGRAVSVTRPNPYEWDVTGHDGTVHIRYKVYGDRVDGTYLAIDTTHAHINMPALFMWARGLDLRAIEVRFEPPSGARWKVATQLHPSEDPNVFTAPNLQYFMDSPIELSNFVLRTFRVSLATSQSSDEGRSAASPGEPAVFHVALHHQGTEADADRLAADIEKIVREEGLVYGEFPTYDVGSYTFLADNLPYASGDGMEHRNSTVMTIGRSRPGGLVDTAAHEFFHCWNVERIRPRSLEPFDFDDTNMSGELWLAEGFTTYYESLILRRAGLQSLEATAGAFVQLVNMVARSPGRRVRTAEEMSRLAPFVDAARAVDRTNWDNTFISYYTWGAAIGLALDLSLRDRTAGRATLDDFMRAMWQKHGKPGGRLEGYVDQPYTMADARDRLAEVSDRGFADDFFARYVQGHDVVDYRRLLARAGLLLRNQEPGHASIGELRLDYTPDGARVTAPTPFESPAYRAGVEQDDALLTLDGDPIRSADRLEAVLRRHKPGDTVTAVFLRRGSKVSAPLTLAEDQEQELVPTESTGRALTDAERAFRTAWLGSRATR